MEPLTKEQLQFKLAEISRIYYNKAFEWNGRDGYVDARVCALIAKDVADMLDRLSKR